MFSIQSIMLVALGFLAATLIALVVAPVYRRRTVRLTTRRLKETLPLSEAEIRADKDRLRAEYAIRVHKLEMKVEQSNLQKARQLIEMNRRDGMISTLEQQVAELSSQLEANQNARRVLEQTVSDRLPKVEQRLNEAKTLLFDRDREIAQLTATSERHRLALDEATSINAQQSSELDRLNNALTVRGARNQRALADPSFEGELALRSEIEALRSKTRDQAAVIGRMQAQMARTPGHDADAAGPASLTPAEAAAPIDAQAERDTRALRTRLQDQAGEIARLTAELAALSGGEADGARLKDSKIALRARLSGLKAQTDQQAETIRRLRVELAGANERLALQGQHFLEQMRRLGVGTLPASGQTRSPVTKGTRATLSERVAQQRAAQTSGRRAAAGESAEQPPSSAPQLSIVAVEPESAATASAPAAAGAPPPAEGARKSSAAPLPDVERPAPQRKVRLIDRISNVSSNAGKP